MSEHPFPYAEPKHLGSKWDGLTGDELADLERGLKEASVLVREALKTGGIDPATVEGDVLETVVCRMVRRAFDPDPLMPSPVGADSQQISVGPFQRTFKFAGGAGQLYLGKADLRLLGLGRQKAFSIDLLAGTDYAS